MQLYTTTHEGKQVKLQHRKLAMSPNATYAKVEGYLSIGHTTVSHAEERRMQVTANDNRLSLKYVHDASLKILKRS